MITVGGPQSEIEAEARKKLITEREMKSILSNGTSSKDLRQAKSRMRELLSFYDRIITSIDLTVRSVKSKPQLSQQQKQHRYLNKQEKELAQAKIEKSKFRRYLKKINDKLDET